MIKELGLPSKKTFRMEDYFLKYKVLLGNKLKFTNAETYSLISGLNFSGNTIFDLDKAIISLKNVLIFIKKIKEKKGIILFVGTRNDLKEITKQIGSKTKSPYVNESWVKGLLTNWENTSDSICFYKVFLKKLNLKPKRKNKVIRTYFGLQNLKRLPDAVFIFDVVTDKDALKEAKLLNIPVIAISDTNTPLKNIDYPILGNSGSIVPLAFFSNLIVSVLRKKKR